MPILQSLILGFVQALTEFLPVSSSAHLVILPNLFGWNMQSLAFDLILHLGTLCALLFIFGKDFYTIVNSLLSDAKTYKVRVVKYSATSKFGLLIGLACIPAVSAGLLFGTYIENTFRNLTSIIIFLSLGTALLFVADYFSKKNAQSSSLTSKNALTIGVFQILALFPGVSRSGSTISAGLLLRFSRLESARFSFMLSVPMVLAAASYEFLKNYESVIAYPPASLITGFLASFIGGIIVIRVLLKFLTHHSLKVFIVYRIILTVFLVLVSLR